MDKKTKSILIGLILGDGHLNKNKTGTSVALEISHCGEQKSYLEYKAKLLEDILGCKPLMIHKRKDKEEYKISKACRYFRVLYKCIYVDKKKLFSKKLLSYLTPEAVALWYMDDGSHTIDHNKKTGRITSHKILLYTFTNKEDTQNIIDFFLEEYNTKFYPIKKIAKDGSETFYLQCRTKEGRKFCEKIRPYILPQFEYKLIN